MIKRHLGTLLDVLSASIDRLQRTFDVDETEYPAPSWLADTDVIDLVTHDRENREYISTMSAERDYELDPDRPFNAVDVGLTDPEAVESATFDATFRDDSENWTNSVTFTPDPSNEARDPLSFSVESTTSASEATVSVDLDRTGSVTKGQSRITMPKPRSESLPPNVFIISIDTLRYDARDHLRPLVESLGPGATIPAEPRTQGMFTLPSHASMLTGVHPGSHGYVGFQGEGGVGIDPSLTTLTSVLTDNTYATDGIVSHTKLAPQYGFGDSFDRYQINPMENWVDRDFDARKTVNDMIETVETHRSRDGGQFGFFHLFDPHSPYIPPLDRLSGRDIDLARIAEYRDTIHEWNWDYLDQVVDPEIPIDESALPLVREYYEESVLYTAEQLTRFVDALKTTSQFDRSLIIVTGDHGEDLWERGFHGHKSLYDTNIRPFMLVKPPADADWTVPDAANTIDFFPTVAHLLGTEPPSQCQGRAWQTAETPPEVRITERIRPDWYNVAVEKDGTKAIFTYSQNYPDRPRAEQVDTGPEHVEYYELAKVRNGDVSDQGSTLDPATKRELKRHAEAFILEEMRTASRSDADIQRPSIESEERLQYLGYKT
jgi:arylsulfatase A-like enzyme